MWYFSKFPNEITLIYRSFLQNYVEVNHFHYKKWFKTMTFAMYGDCRKMVLPPSRLPNAEAINYLDAEIADGCRNLVS